MIGWKYLDKQQAALGALYDYRTMETIMRITPAEIKNLYEEMTNLKIPVPDGMPHARSTGSSENELCGSIDQCNMLYKRYQAAAEFMVWFRPAYLQLYEEERILLEAFYFDDENRTEAIKKISKQFKIERAQIYRRKNKALYRLAKFLYGL